MASLSTLSVIPPLNFAGSMALTLTAIALESSNGDEASNSVGFNVTVTPVADAVEILAQDVSVGSTGASSLSLNVRMADDSNHRYRAKWRQN